MKNKHLGSNFDDFLEEENIHGEAEAIAIKRVLAFALEQEMAKLHLSKKEMASRMTTSRSALDRLLDPDNTSVTLGTLVKAAAAMNKRLELRILD